MKAETRAKLELQITNIQSKKIAPWIPVEVLEWMEFPLATWNLYRRGAETQSLEIELEDDDAEPFPIHELERWIKIFIESTDYYCGENQPVRLRVWGIDAEGKSRDHSKIIHPAQTRQQIANNSPSKRLSNAIQEDPESFMTLLKEGDSSNLFGILYNAFRPQVDGILKSIAVEVSETIKSEVVDSLKSDAIKEVTLLNDDIIIDGVFRKMEQMHAELGLEEEEEEEEQKEDRKL